MKKLIAALLITSVFASCGKEGAPEPEPTESDYTCPTCTVAPEALPKNDTMSSGVYKGVLVGSSGTIAVYIHNEGTEKKAELKLDGKSTMLTTTSLDEWTPGEPIDKALFTGMLKGEEVQLVFSVGAHGLDAIADVTVPGHHDLTSFIYKESSNVAIKSFEGDYSGDEGKGVFNLVVNGNDVSIILSGKGAPMQTRVENRLIEFVSENGFLITGKFYNDAVGGSLKNIASGGEGGWKALRTL